MQAGKLISKDLGCIVIRRGDSAGKALCIDLGPGSVNCDSLQNAAPQNREVKKKTTLYGAWPVLTVYRNSPKEITEEWNLGLDTGGFSAAKINGAFHSTITLGEEERECVRGSV